MFRKNLFIAGITLMLLGMLIMFVGPLMTFALKGSSSASKVAAGGCIVVAFIPICFGYGTNWTLLLVLAIIGVVIAVVMYILMRNVVRGVGFEPTQAYASGSLT